MDDDPGLDASGRHGRDAFVNRRVERPADAFDRVSAGLAEGLDEKPVRGHDAFIEIWIGRPGGERALEGVQDGQEGQQRRALPVAASGLLLARRATADVVEVGAQPEMPLLLFVEGMAQALDLVALNGPSGVGIAIAHPIIDPPHTPLRLHRIMPEISGGEYCLRRMSIRTSPLGA
jgi:hypothetical protein